MLKSRTPFRQLTRLYSTVLSTGSMLNRTHELLMRLRDEAGEQTAYLETRSKELTAQLSAVSDQLRGIVSRPGIEGSRAVGHTWQDSAQMMADLRRQINSSMPDNVALQGWSSYSQCDEDGMIRACLERIATMVPLSNTFIEIGCGNGLENNTHQLLLDGFRGAWLDGSASNIGFIAEQLGSLTNKALLVTEAFATLTSTGPLIDEFSDFLGTQDIDFFSFDIDGNDLHLMPIALNSITPKLICVEYNGKFPPPTRMAMSYAEQHRWAEDDYYGASLQAWVDLFAGKYTLVSCNLSGVNAFFVRNDLLGPFTIYSTARLYQPCRYWLVGNNGHRASLKWLKQMLS